MYLGFHPGIDLTINVTTANDFAGTRRAWNLPAGTAPIGRAFPNGAVFDPTSTPGQVVAHLDQAAAPILAAGMWPYLSLKPDPSATLAGQLDAHLTAIGKWATTVAVPVYFSVHHEPENDTLGVNPLDYLTRARTFVQLHTRAYRLIKAVAGAAILMGPCHLVYKWGAGHPETMGGLVADAWQVPDDARDFVAADSYTSNTSWSGMGATLHAKGDFQRWLSYIAPPAGQLVLAERGVSCNGTAVGPDSQAAVLISDYLYLKSLGAHAMLCWSSGGAIDNSVFTLGAPGRLAFLLAALDAANNP